MPNASRVLAIKSWQQRRLKVDWLDNLIITAGVVRDASDLIPFPYVRPAAAIIVQVLLKIQTVRKHVDDFRDLSEILVGSITTVRDTVRDLPQDQSLPIGVVHCCLNFVNRLLTLQTGIDELVRQNGSWTRFFRTTTILDAIARYKEQINHMRSDFTLEVVIRIYMKGAEGQRPRHLVHCFYILDATNKTLPVPMHYGYSFDALEDFVKYRFRNHLGHEVIERGDFSLSLQGVEDEEWQELYKHNSDEWLPLIEPGITITMDIHYEDESYGKPTNPICPSCHYPCARSSFQEYIECPRCETLVNNWSYDLDVPLHDQDTDEVATSESAILIGPLAPSKLPGNSSNLSAQGLHVNDNNLQNPHQFFCRFWVPLQVCHVLPVLHSAVWEKNMDTVIHLLEENADVNAAEGCQGDTPLHVAAYHGHSDIAELLLNHNADVDARDHLGRNPLHVVALRRYSDIAELLLNHNADVHARDSEGDTPLHVAALYGRLYIAELLLNHNADVDARDCCGQTPLHLAALCGHLDVAELLLNQNADVNTRNQWERTPLHTAASWGNLEIVKLLLKHNADVHARDYKGGTPLDWARKGYNRPSKEVILLLESYMNASG